MSNYNLYIMPSNVIDINKIISDLEKKGLKIIDYKLFKYYISNFNYNTFIEEYKDFFMDGERFIHGTTTSDLIGLYNFDKNFANHILRDILVVEKRINTNVIYGTINQLHLVDKKLLKIKKHILKEQVFSNIGSITPSISFDMLLSKATKYLDTKKDNRKYIDKREKDYIFKWRNMPLDIMCLSWSFATTFSFFVALNNNIKNNVLEQLGIPSSFLSGFQDFVQNSIHTRNLISHNIVIFTSAIKYQSENLNKLYEYMFSEKISDGKFRISHLIKLIGKFSNNDRLYIKTIEHINRLEVSEQNKQKILNFFIL